MRTTECCDDPVDTRKYSHCLLEEVYLRRDEHDEMQLTITDSNEPVLHVRGDTRETMMDRELLGGIHGDFGRQPQSRDLNEPESR